ncbi:hypothetical protein C1646_765997 [Rhizophagus diaphanus]|nr:hypothetical protein C1646_765997 [Rhizophagus diaphanus] [Rhizophagus sp. MUCL 43196]
MFHQKVDKACDEHKRQEKVHMAVIFCWPCTLEDAKQLAYNRKGACLSEYYINNRSALLWMCDKKHRWFATFDNVKHLNS